MNLLQEIEKEYIWDLSTSPSKKLGLLETQLTSGPVKLYFYPCDGSELQDAISDLFIGLVQYIEKVENSKNN